MKITDLSIDLKSIGKKLLLVDVVPVFKYQDGKKVKDSIIAYRYVCALPEKAFEKIGVKIEGNLKLEKPDGYVEVTFDGLELFIYWKPGNEYSIGATATNIRPIGKAA